MPGGRPPKSWRFFPRRMMDTDAYLELDERTALMLHRLYVKADRHGRFPAGPAALARITALRPDTRLDGSPDYNLDYCLDILARAGFVRVFSDRDTGLLCGELVGWADDGPRDEMRNRGEPRWNPSPDGLLDYNPDYRPDSNPPRARDPETQRILSRAHASVSESATTGGRCVQPLGLPPPRVTPQPPDPQTGFGEETGTLPAPTPEHQHPRGAARMRDLMFDDDEEDYELPDDLPQPTDEERAAHEATRVAMLEELKAMKARLRAKQAGEVADG